MVQKKYQPPPKRNISTLEPDLAFLSRDVQVNRGAVEEFRCFKCNGVGHMKRDCQSRYPKELVCHGCGKPGVIRPNCPQCSKNAKAGSSATVCAPAYRIVRLEAVSATLSVTPGRINMQHSKQMIPRYQTQDAIQAIIFVDTRSRSTKLSVRRHTGSCGLKQFQQLYRTVCAPAYRIVRLEAVSATLSVTPGRINMQHSKQMIPRYQTQDAIQAIIFVDTRSRSTSKCKTVCAPAYRIVRLEAVSATLSVTPGRINMQHSKQMIPRYQTQDAIQAIIFVDTRSRSTGKCK
ncbi:unnamed protein product [Brassicogethes aeneus]|uniref:CCHC-type domain-containing protein n=1 Tax=Brassicogethes aeneus TaxID=1431903 RepID=A0A9P0B791_BRAAE|nr:unnamed protein product [Brassicogethes aeneus]